MIPKSADILEELEQLYDEADLNFDRPTHAQLYVMYGIFLEDFHKNTLIHKGKKIKINTNFSKHPLFRNKFETFVHIVTRDNTYNDKRQYDRDRANRIHWIRPILENCDNPKILYFERKDKEGIDKYYYWYEKKNFIVILKQAAPDWLIVTAFCVDDYNKMQYKKYWKEYRWGMK